MYRHVFILLAHVCNLRWLLPPRYANIHTYIRTYVEACLRTYRHGETHTRNLYASVARPRAHKYTIPGTHIRTYIRTYIHTRMGKRTHAICTRQWPGHACIGTRFHVHTYIHAYMHAYMHACIHTWGNAHPQPVRFSGQATSAQVHDSTYTHACIHTYTYTYIRRYMHTYIQTYMGKRTHATCTLQWPGHECLGKRFHRQSQLAQSAQAGRSTVDRPDTPSFLSAYAGRIGRTWM